MSNCPTRPALRYHGGKWRLAPWIVSHFPEHRVYTEAFGGAASVLLRKAPCYAEIYNDLDGEIVNLFRVLRDPDSSLELARLLRLTPFARTEFLGAYLPSGCPIETARATIIKSFMGFGSNAIHRPSGFRSNSNRSGTTPAHDWARFPAQVEMFCTRLGGVVIEHRDALDVISTHDSSQTLHYVDPPYVASTRNKGRDYLFEMTDTEHETLSKRLHSVQGMVILSGYASGLYRELYGDWVQVSKDAHADGARDRTETLWLNPAAADAGARLALEVA